MVFLLDSWLALYTDAVGLCISTAFFLHYFLLSSFTWMGLEAFHLYLSIVKVFRNFVSHYMLKFSLVGWGEFLQRTFCQSCVWTLIRFPHGALYILGVPLIVVIIVISVDKNNYGLVTYGKYANGSTDDL